MDVDGDLDGMHEDDHQQPVPATTTETPRTARFFGADASNPLSFLPVSPSTARQVNLEQVLFNFYSNGQVVRSRKYAYCNTITKLFAQAKTAGIVSINSG